MKRFKLHNSFCKMAKKPGVLNAWLLVFIGLFSALALPFSLSQTAQAQEARYTYIDTDLYEDITAYAWRNAIGSCVDVNHSIPADYDEIDRGEWFVTGDVTVTPLLDSTDAKRECETPFTVNTAMESFGFESNVEAACYLGLIERANGDSNCLNGSGDFSPTDADPHQVMEAIDRKRFYNPNDPINPGFSWNDAKYYIVYARSMEIGCRATPFKPFVTATDSEKSRAGPGGSNTYLTMDVVNPDGSVTEMIYSLGGEQTRDSEIGMTVQDLEDTYKTCQELASDANRFSDAYAAYVKGDPPAEDDQGSGGTGGGDDAAQETTCDIDGLGWILCPAMTVIGLIVDSVYAVVSGMLTVQPITTDTTSPLFNAWSIMRNFANVAFVIAFLIIIYSQITSVGISNYNIKKMLPRLVVAAILVNISYWLCAIAVDASNISGASIKGLLDGLVGQVGEDGQPALLAQVGGWAGLTGLVLAGAVIGVYIGLSVLLPILVGALIAIITVVVILTLRQALIIILIVISPLAFVAFLLPNTEGLFNSWRKIFVALLLMFPIVAAIFGGSALAGNIILNSAEGNILVQIVGAGVTVIPLFLSAIMMFLMRSIGGAIGRLTGMVNRPDKGVFDRMKKGAEGYRTNRQSYRKLKGMNGVRSLPGASWAIRKRSDRQGVIANRQRELARAEATHLADKTANDEKFREKLAQGGGEGAAERAKSAAVAAQKNIEIQAIKDAEISANIPRSDTQAMANRLAEAVRAGDSVTAQAMQNMLLKSGHQGIKDYRQVMTDKVDNAIDYNSEIGHALRDNILENHGGIKKDAADLITQAGSGIKMSEASRDAATWKMSDADLVGQKDSSLGLAINSGAVTKEQAARIASNPQLTKEVSADNMISLQNIAGSPPRNQAKWPKTGFGP